MTLIKRMYDYVKSIVMSFLKRQAKNPYTEWLKMKILIDTKEIQPNYTTVIQVLCFNYIECPYDCISSVLKEQETLEFVNAVKTSHNQVIFGSNVNNYTQLSTDEFDTTLLHNNIIPLPIIQIFIRGKPAYRRLPLELCEYAYEESSNIKNGFAVYPSLMRLSVTEERRISFELL